MQLLRTFSRFGCCFLMLMLVSAAPGSEEPIFELPVQLIGFPVIILSVRIANFLKKLAYALSPDTYVSRVKRAHPLIYDEEILDVGQIEKKLVAELGNNVCVYERICAMYAERTLQRRSRERFLDWNEVFRTRSAHYCCNSSMIALRKRDSEVHGWENLCRENRFHGCILSLIRKYNREYKSSPNPMKENYLLSVFLGDIIGSPKLCHLLAKRGRACDNAILSD